MKKRILFILLLSIVLVACGDNNDTSNNKEENEIELTSLSEKYNVEGFKISRGKKTSKGLKAYQDYDDDVIDYIGEQHNIDIEYIVLSNMEDTLIAFENDRIDVITSMTAITDESIKGTYSYHSEPFYYPNGLEFDTPSTFRFGVKSGNEDLLNFLNDAILEMEENGILEELYDKHIGERASLEHIKLSEVTEWDYIENLTPEEREELLDDLEDYKKIIDVESK